MKTGTSSLLDVFHQIDLEPVKGEGVWLFAADGRRYLDFYGGHAVALLGYNHPRLVSTLDSEARRLFFQSNAVELAVRERAAEALLRFGPKGFTKVFFVNSGAEANENALRVAFLATRRKRVVAVRGAFHGRTAAVSAVTDGSDQWYAFPQRPFEVTWVPFDDEHALAGAIRDDVAAVIVEPVQGLAGARALSRSFLERMGRLATEWGAVLIFDEVQSGMGRTGWPFAAQHHGIAPDILTTAKGLAGGFPAAAMLVGDDLAARVKKGDLGTTFGAGPMACALVEAVVTAIEEEDLLPRVRKLSAMLREKCVVGPVQSVQGLGYLLGLRTSVPAKQVLAGLRERGILAGGSNDPNVVRLLPPLILEEDHVDLLVSALADLPGAGAAK
jgi:acetylornithine/succinyldiaminopimelate/putrescine aminotransferase